jgi:hypothetical protein
MVQLNHLDSHGTVYLVGTVLKCTVASRVVDLYHSNQLYHGIPWYAMVQLHHPDNLGTIYHGITMVKSNVVFEVVHLYHGKQLYHGIQWYNCTTPKTQVQFTKP